MNSRLMFYRSLILLFVFLDCTVGFAQDRETILKKNHDEGKFEEIIEGLQPLVKNPEFCEPYDFYYLTDSYFGLGDYENGLFYADYWLKQAVGNNDTTQILKASQYKIAAFIQLRAPKKGIVAANQALAYCTTAKTISAKNLIKLKLGCLYLYDNRVEEGYEVYKDVQFDLLNGGDKLDEYYTNFAIIHAKMGNIDSSIYYTKKSLPYEQDESKNFQRLLSYSNLAASYYDLEEYRTALTYLDSGMAIGVEKTHPIYELVYENYSKSYAELGIVDSSYHYITQLKELNKQLFQEKLDREIVELRNAYKREAVLRTEVVKSEEDLAKSEIQLLLSVIIILLILFVAAAIILYLRYKNIKTSRDKLLINQQLLRTQITPHFLFNALSTIQGMILQEESSKASDYLSKFSRLVRLILNNSRSRAVPLTDELEAINYYLELQKARFEDSLDYQIRVDNNLENREVLIPPMLIQPFVENCLEHGFKNLDRTGEIDLHVYFENKSLLCKITDNGIGIDAAAKESILPKKESLSTTINLERMSLMAKEFKSKANLMIEDRKKLNEQGTIVTLEIPYKYD